MGAENAVAVVVTALGESSAVMLEHGGVGTVPKSEDDDERREENYSWSIPMEAFSEARLNMFYSSRHYVRLGRLYSIRSSSL